MNAHMEQNFFVTLPSGNGMPPIGLGTWQLADTAEVIERALELGYPMFDTSGDYRTQPGIGQGIRNTGVARDAFFLTTKVEETGDAYAATRKNLDELGLDYADLMLVHRPPDDGVGEALWQGLLRAREEGLAKDIGVSNYSAEQIRQLTERTGEQPAVNQVEWTPFGFSDSLLDFCRERGIAIQAYSPLTRATRLDDPVLARIGKKYGKTAAQVMLRWNLQRGTIPIPKAHEVQHLAQNMEIFDFALSVADLSVLNELNEHYSSLGKLPYV